ncbi:SDR family NAD(P)-dependent oxidoreductase [Nocardioides sp. ChNu-99]|uniref:SDR family NAD(P)-dependent oxidoreductase n=1 Tax=Nocardioides sp. ChNu-99 TaxID=2839897 RepID=UPI002404AD26|nr:SDR family NAD(P)-dependent oxidoreductase [Nocardioides sp. ChNu-99]MDF9717814.1 SDR family NAD(P)-dependent oxidoreductase [Nocardioides sp. ChNu-99]
MARITTRFGARSTADEVVAGVDLTGRRAVVTGGASGIGVETARSLARAGAEVTIAVRDVEAGRRAAADIAASLADVRGAGTVEVAHLDLVDLVGVARFAEAWDGPLHLLVDNAGVMAVPERRTTSYGWELQLATNHLGHHALTTGLHDALAAEGARIVSVSSSGHLASPVVLDDLQFERRPYDPWSAYGQSKTANVLLAVEATRRWAGDGITANALMPGGIMTRLQRHVPEETQAEWRRYEGLKTPQQGAATTLVAAVAPELEGIGGRYLEDGNEAETVDDDAQVGAGVRRWALDPTTATRLWDLSTAAVDRVLGR